MTKNNTDLKQELSSALQEIGVATKKDVKEIIQTEVQAAEKKISRKMRAEHKIIRKEISQLATSSPTYKQFTDLKTKVDRFHRTN